LIIGLLYGSIAGYFGGKVDLIWCVLLILLFPAGHADHHSAVSSV